MKISEFAAMNNVTTKMLRHYDDIGLLTPSNIDNETGYRIYTTEQSKYLSWILILKNLDFSLSQIKEMLAGSISSSNFIKELLQKRVEISLNMNEQFQKKVQIERLIKILEKDGFSMEKQINLLNFDNDDINQLKKNMPNMEQFLENINTINSVNDKNDSISILRLDLSHFKQVNDDYGHDVGDRVILAIYKIIQSSISSLEQKATLGRMGGDEFAVFAIGDTDTLVQISNNIINNMRKFDFKSLGCDRQVGCYIGILTSEPIDMRSIRKMLDETMETISKARKNGPNSIFAESFNE